MRKNIIISLCAAAAIGIGVWAAIFAALGSGGQQTIITSSDEETKTAGAAAETNWGAFSEGAKPRPRRFSIPGSPNVSLSSTGI